jgi:hypothetical protein
MAAETSPTAQPPGEAPRPETYQFEAAEEELSPTDAFLDTVLTRAGELVLDVIEGVEEHPLLAASIMAVIAGGATGLLVAGLWPRRPAGPRWPPLAVSFRGRWPGDVLPRPRAPRLSGRRGRAAPAAGRLTSTIGRALRQGRYASQLVPIALALLRNPLVRELVAQALAGRLRRRARL